MRLLFALLIATFCFAIEREELLELIKKKDTQALQKIIDKTKVYENISKIPSGLKEGDTIITQDEYGSKTFFIQEKDGNINEFNEAFFVKLLNKDSGSTFSHIFTSSTKEAFDSLGKNSNTENPFKAYISETEALRVSHVMVSSQTDVMEKALNDHLLNNNINPASIITIQLFPSTKAGEMTLYLFYRP